MRMFTEPPRAESGGGAMPVGGSESICGRMGAPGVGAVVGAGTGAVVGGLVSGADADPDDGGAP